MSLVGLLISLLIFGLVIWVVSLPPLNNPPWLRSVIYAIVAIIFIVYLIQALVPLGRPVIRL